MRNSYYFVALTYPQCAKRELERGSARIKPHRIFCFTETSKLLFELLNVRAQYKVRVGNDSLHRRFNLHRDRLILSLQVNKRDNHSVHLSLISSSIVSVGETIQSKSSSHDQASEFAPQQRRFSSRLWNRDGFSL